MQGEVFIKGRRRFGLLSDDPEISKLLTVGMVFQNGALFDSLTVGQNVGFLLYQHTKLPASQIEVPLLPKEVLIERLVEIDVFSYGPCRALQLPL